MGYFLSLFCKEKLFEGHMVNNLLNQKVILALRATYVAVNRESRKINLYIILKNSKHFVRNFC